MLARTLLALSCLTLALAAPPSPAAEAVPGEVVALRVRGARIGEPRNTISVDVAAEIAKGWHINAHDPGKALLVPTELTIAPPEGWQVGEVRYPKPEERVLAFAGTEKLRLYSGTVVFGASLTAPPGFDGKTVRFEARLRHQACSDALCLRPTTTARTFVVQTVRSEAAAPVGRTIASNVAPVDRWIEERGLPLTLLLVAVMGFALNLTPCVYPLISVTIAYFGHQAQGSRSRVLLLATVYALGIAITFSVLGVVAALTGGLFGAALTHPATLVAMAALMIVLALSCFGFYTMQAPSWLLQRAGGSTGAGVLGSLAMGSTMGVVAAPCVGPIIVGLLMTVGSRGDPLLGLLLFFTLAIGLGAPYVLIAAAAGSLTGLPRSGEWLVWVERFLGCLLIGMAIYFVSPLLPDQIVARTVPVFLAAAGIYLGFIERSGGGMPRFAAVKRAVGVALVGASLWTAIPSSTAADDIVWRRFSERGLDQARSTGAPAVLDFRADWCLPCVEMERTTFVAPEVVARAKSFVMLQADVTEMSAANERLLARYKVVGVPTTIFYDRDGAEHARMVGYVAADEFARLLDQAAAGDSEDSEATRAARGKHPGRPEG
ncbi:MAG: thioredoxin:protein disulfide reductase [Candidatus Binatota bacterium]|nr:thioredoxin:protein disulfide reductase [Candidatus Binatota bacterium]